MVIKNIDKREEVKKKNKILLEKLIILGKKFKKNKKVNSYMITYSLKFPLFVFYLFSMLIISSIYIRITDSIFINSLKYL